MMPPSKQYPHDNIIRQILCGSYRLNGFDHSSIRSALETIFEKKLPTIPLRYKGSYYNIEDGNIKGGACTFETDSIDDVINIAYHYPTKFKCGGLNNIQKEFITDILEYKITEKLKS